MKAGEENILRLVNWEEMLLKIKKYKRQQVIIKFGKATMIIVVSMKCGMKTFQMISGEKWEMKRK